LNVFIKSSDDEEIKKDWGGVLLSSPAPELPGRCVEEQPVHSNFNMAGLILCINPGKYPLL